MVSVAFALDGDGLVVRVESDSQLNAGLRDAMVALETGDADSSRGTGGSVSVTGVTSDVTDAGGLERAHDLPLEE